MSTTHFIFTDQHKKFIRVGKGHVPAYLLDGEAPILFDPGISAYGPLYHRKLIEVANGQTDTLLLLFTHSHFDHCGAAPYLLRKFPKAKVGASIRAAEVFNKQSAINLMRRLNAEYEEEMKEELHGEDITFTAIKVDMRLKEGDKVVLKGGNSFQVYETPGHTRDCLSFFFPDCGVLLAGEAAGVPEEDTIHSAFLSDYEEYINSIKKLNTLNAEALCIAHVGILIGNSTVREYFSKSVKAAEDYREKIERYLKKYNGDQEKVINTITKEEYDSRSNHIINRTPFILNLQAKVNAVCRLLGK